MPRLKASAEASAAPAMTPSGQINVSVQDEDGASRDNVALQESAAKLNCITAPHREGDAPRRSSRSIPLTGKRVSNRLIGTMRPSASNSARTG
jgi:hypothetical protein